MSPVGPYEGGVTNVIAAIYGRGGIERLRSISLCLAPYYSVAKNHTQIFIYGWNPCLDVVEYTPWTGSQASTKVVPLVFQVTPDVREV